MIKLSKHDWNKYNSFDDEEDTDPTEEKPPTNG